MVTALLILKEAFQNNLSEPSSVFSLHPFWS